MAELSKDPVEIEFIKEDAQIKLTVPTGLYTRIQNLMLEMFAFKDHEEFNLTLKKITEGNIGDNVKAYHLETILILMKDLEDSAREQGFMFKKKVIIETNTIVED
jgi:hypothetical protein